MNQFLERYKELGEEFNPEEFEMKKSLRINTLKTDENVMVARLKKLNINLDKIPFLDFGYYFSAEFSLGATPEYLFGYYYLQEVASQLPVQVLQPQPGDLVLDMAASPGSKTTQIAQYMENKGNIIALDDNLQRLDSLRNNLERCGITNCVIYKKDARFVTDFNLEFNKILLDAPCSGNFAIDKDFFDKRDLAGIKQNSKVQRELLKAAVKVLKKGGVLVYSTCSLEPEENEMNINWLLNNFDNLSLEETGLELGDEGLVDVFGEKLNPEIKKCRRFWPHKTKTEGFFITKIKKS
ncbi:MAG: RsmB/NOP family class I SAM-dependent RNA methyltransferase [archaeon]